MIGVITRLLQLLVIGGLVFVIARPSVLPEPARTMAKNVHVWIMGETDSWDNFQTTWKLRFEQAGSLIPWFKTLATTIPPDPPQITADSILTILGKLVITQPKNKFDTIKNGLLAVPTASTTGGTLYNGRHE